VQRATAGVSVRSAWLVSLGVLGAALFYGDSVITPAISVLSALEGLKVAAPAVSHLTVPLALAVLTVLFAVQRSGTAVIGRVFGPLMVLWFAAIGAIGAREVAAHPEIVRGLAPRYAVEFVVDRPGVAFAAMGAVMLAITGAEALYADMGHFGRPPITVISLEVPRADDRDRLTIDDLGFDDDNIVHVTARFGFQEQPDVPLALRMADAKGLECDIDTDGPTYFLSRSAIRMTDEPGMSRWRKRLFAAGHDVADPVDYFGLPLERTILVGSHVPL
jgi:K+ transporter